MSDPHRVGAPPRFSRTPHLVDLVAEAERLAAIVAGAPIDDGLQRELVREAALASLRLDGSPVGDEAPVLPEQPAGPAADATADTNPPADPPAPEDGPATGSPVGSPPRRRGTWLDALRPDRLEDADEQAIVARELANVLAALAADELAEPLLTAPVETLARLHRRLTVGLLDEAHAGVPRRSEQAVQDASVGRILYFPTEPDRIPARLHALAGWLVSAAAREHGLVMSGVLHHELLLMHPYEAANGRLARAAARLVLRARGLDPSGLAGPELVLLRDPIGYYEEVQRTVRRRDLSIWLERWGEAVAGGLRVTARRLGLLDPHVPDRAHAFLAAASGAFTITDYRAAAGVGPQDARSDLGALLDAGAVVRRPGARGLRYDRA